MEIRLTRELQTRSTSLTGRISTKWLADGRPRWSWDDLLKKAVQSDIELEQIGCNPAPKFRQLRESSDETGMHTYIAGFYQYPFAPNYREKFRSTSKPVSEPTSKRLIIGHKLQRIRGTNALGSTIRSTNALIPARGLIELYHYLKEKHPHELLPLETKLPRELRFDQRDIYRIIITMILSGRMADFQLTESLKRFFGRFKSFDDLRGITENDVMRELKLCGFAYYSTHRGGNGARLWTLLNLYFGLWGQTISEQQLRNISGAGFGPKFRHVLHAYVIGDTQAFPLDSPAFETLKGFGFYLHCTLDEARNDVLEKLRDFPSPPLIDFHELLRFRSQFGELSHKSELKRRQSEIILGWNGWRILSVRQRAQISAQWVKQNLIKDEGLATDFARWFL
jgi:hypothetical protein